MKLLSIISIVLMLLLTGCNRNLEQENKNAAKDIVNDLVYVKDEKTGLCFAYSWYSGPIFTEVSCRDVKDYLIK